MYSHGMVAVMNLYHVWCQAAREVELEVFLLALRSNGVCFIGYSMERKDEELEQ